jgi:sirohydrochlorin ferrochelatase
LKPFFVAFQPPSGRFQASRAKMAGAAAVRRDIPEATIRFFETGHFALETHANEIAAAIQDFLGCASA